MTALALLGTRRAMRVVERNTRSYLRMWPAFISGFFEPAFYLFSIGIGVGALVGQLPGPDGTLVDYDQYVAPAMMAVAAMNGCDYCAHAHSMGLRRYGQDDEAIADAQPNPGP